MWNDIRPPHHNYTAFAAAWGVGLQQKELIAKTPQRLSLIDMEEPKTGTNFWVVISNTPLFFIFTPTWGHDSTGLNFSNGLKPPTRFDCAFAMADFEMMRHVYSIPIYRKYFCHLLCP